MGTIISQKFTYEELEHWFTTLEKANLDLTTDVERLTKSLKEYRALIENQTDLVIKIDTEGRFLFVSPSYCKMFGMTKRELLGKNFLPHVHNEDRDDVIKNVEALFSPPYSGCIEQRAVTKDGCIWLSWEGKAVLDDNKNVISIVGIGRDISNRKLAEQRLKEQEEKYRTLFESSIDAITIIDADTNKFIDCNNAAVKLHDTKDRENLFGMTPAQLSPTLQPNGKSSQKLSAEYIQETYQKGFNRFEWTHCKSDGTLFPVIITLSPMVLGEKRFVLSIAKDITHRKIAEEGREKLIKALQKSLEKVKTLSGLVPICSQCKKIRDDKGYWNQLEDHIQKHSYASFTHGICPECSDELYGDEDWYIEMKKK